MAETIYIRNLRPNRVILKYADLREVLERRGSREDSTSLPADSKNDPIISRWLSAGMIEEISKEDFLSLTSSLESFDPNRRNENEPALKNNTRSKAVPMSHDNSATPTVIDTDVIDRTLLSPKLDYQVDPREESNLAPQEVSVSDYHKGDTGRPEQLTNRERAELEMQLAEANERAEKAEATAAAAKKKAPAKKRTPKRAASASKSTK